MTAPVDTRLIQAVGILETFAYLGIAYLILTGLSALFMQNPPDGWRPPGWSPTAAQVSNRSAKDYSLGEALRTPQWWGLWLLLFLNTSAGIFIISQVLPLFQELACPSAVVSAGLGGITQIGKSLRR